MDGAAKIQVVDAASSGCWDAAIEFAIEYELQLVGLFADDLDAPEGLRRTQRLVRSMFKKRPHM